MFLSFLKKTVLVIYFGKKYISNFLTVFLNTKSVTEVTENLMYSELDFYFANLPREKFSYSFQN